MMNYKLLMNLFLLLLGVGYCQVNESTRTAIPPTQMAHQCSPWFFYNATTKQCECYKNPSTDHIVICTENGALLRFGYCLTYEEGEGYYIGLCDYFNLDKYNRSTKNNYISLPDNISELNEHMCGALNRKGIICGQCIDGYGPSVTSMGHTCSDCTGAWYGVPLYLFLEFIPITIFYFIVLFFRINMTSAPMLAFVFYCQIGVSSFFVVSNRYLFRGTVTYRALNILVTFYGIWNLDFFRYIIPPFCISPHLKAIHITFLYYISAIYPLCLIVVSWICIQLHSRNNKLIIWLWSPIKWFSTYTNVKWDAKNTMIDVFATFFLLCYAKLVFTCLRIFSYRITLNINNSSTHKIFHVKSDSTVVFFSTEHLPSAIISVIIFSVVLVPTPLILALFPISAFRSLIFKHQFASRRMPSVNAFFDKFYDCYRDGLDGGRDMRSFVSMHFFLRMICNFLSVDDVLINISFSVVVFLYISSSLLMALVQPYKKMYMNITDTLILANLALISLVLNKLSGQENDNSAFSTFYKISGSILSTIPLLGLTAVVIYKVFKKIKHSCYSKSVNQSEEEHKDVEVSQPMNYDSIEDPEHDINLPDRMLHPEEYPNYGSIKQTHLRQCV